MNLECRTFYFVKKASGTHSSWGSNYNLVHLTLSLTRVYGQSVDGSRFTLRTYKGIVKHRVLLLQFHSSLRRCIEQTL